VRTELTVASNRLDVISHGELYWAAASYGSSQEVFVTFVTVDPAASEINLLLKSQANTTHTAGVIEVWYDPIGRRVQVWTAAPSQGWVQRGADIPVTLVNGDQLGARAMASGQVQVYRNGTLLGTRDTSAWPFNAQGGYLGLWFEQATNSLLDDFGGGTVVSAPPQP
jgi:hypothetical protein